MRYRNGTIATGLMPFVALFLVIVTFYAFYSFNDRTSFAHGQFGSFAFKGYNTKTIIEKTVTDVVSATRKDVTLQKDVIFNETFIKKLKIIAEKKRTETQYGDIFAQIANNKFTLISPKKDEYILTVPKVQYVIREGYNELTYSYRLIVSFGITGEVKVTTESLPILL